MDEEAARLVVGTLLQHPPDRGIGAAKSHQGDGGVGSPLGTPLVCGVIFLRGIGSA
jgi:hypothetical protein